ncbi:hypothetical protein PG985_013465 [Apiospora marii]|uniref:uncharacterized protein n=1 Tax=Apiospora marii TaxID=335849 RepID=UPI00313167B0
MAFSGNGLEAELADATAAAAAAMHCNGRNRILRGWEDTLSCGRGVLAGIRRIGICPPPYESTDPTGSSSSSIHDDGRWTMDDHVGSV